MSPENDWSFGAMPENLEQKMGKPSGNQTWLAGKSSRNGGFHGKITYIIGPFSPLSLLGIFFDSNGDASLVAQLPPTGGTMSTAKETLRHDFQWVALWAIL